MCDLCGLIGVKVFMSLFGGGNGMLGKGFDAVSCAANCSGLYGTYRYSTVPDIHRHEMYDINWENRLHREMSHTREA